MQDAVSHVTEHWAGTHPEDVLVEAVDPELAEWQVLIEETVGDGMSAYRWKLKPAVPLT